MTDETFHFKKDWLYSFDIPPRPIRKLTKKELDSIRKSGVNPDGFKQVMPMKKD